MPTRNEITALKDNWLRDPASYDLEDVEGFEAHHDELLAYRREQEARWERERIERLTAKAEALGCPGNLTLAAYIGGLEWQISRLVDVMVEAGIMAECRP